MFCLSIFNTRENILEYPPVNLKRTSPFSGFSRNIFALERQFSDVFISCKYRQTFSDFSFLEEIIPAFLAQEQIFITKETKKGVSQMDIRPGIFSLSVKDGVLHLLTDASSAGNIKPYALLEALLSYAGCPEEKMPPFWAVQFTRLETYTRAEVDGALIALGDVGEAF